MDDCLNPECDRSKTIARGLCGRCYQAAKLGRISFPAYVKPPAKYRPLRERFESAPRRISGDGCIEWAGAKSDRGYGVINGGAEYDRKLFYAHRLAYEYAMGEIPAGLVVRHKCDNPPCCNPDHLEIGTATDNARDMIERGRHPWMWTDGVCKRGHDLAIEENLYVSPNGRRMCAECSRMRSRGLHHLLGS